MKNMNTILGAIIGDIVGSRFEFNNIHTKDFDLFTEENFVTDDTIITLAVAKAILNYKTHGGILENKVISQIKSLGRQYPCYGYGSRFFEWVFSNNDKPYNSYGNGSAMRVSPCVYFADSGLESLNLAVRVSSVTHNHPYGIKGAQAVADMIWLASEGKTKEDMYSVFHDYYYPEEFTIQDIKDTYTFDETCQGTVPQAFQVFIESESFEDAIRSAVALGGDSDTLACITGSIAGAYYGVPEDLRAKALSYLDKQLLSIYNEVEEYNSDTKTCCICGNNFVGWGNNAEPVKKGICCDCCNSEVVIPARLFRLELNRKQVEE